LVDNGSGDRTPQLLQSLRESCHHSITIQPLLENQIQSSYAARNTGIRAAKGAILVFTDADCRPQADWLSELVKGFADPAVGMVAGEILALPGDTLLERYADRHETLSQKHTLAHSFYPYGQTANLAVRRAALEQVGLFRPYLTTGGDADLCWRIQQQSDWQMQFAAAAIVRHRHRATVAELCSQWRRYGRSNRYLHELHGVSLMKEMAMPDYLYRWSRWLLKEAPRAVKNTVMNSPQAGSKVPVVDQLIDQLLDTPLDLLCSRSRAQGQRQASLPALAKEVAWITEEAVGAIAPANATVSPP
jgi:cellulose synthase/poly-beta-1,6-N-acetylglucosamine synthase-like glycosyltransferase